MFTAVQSTLGATCSAGATDPPTLVPYLFERDGWYYFKRKIPAASQWAFNGAKQVWKSLETRDHDEAVKALEARVKAFDMEVQEARQKKGAAVVRREQIRTRGVGTTKYLLDAHIEPLLARFEHAHLTTDDQERSGMTDAERIERRADLEAARDQMLAKAATEAFAGYEEVAQELLSAEQLLAPPGSAIRLNLLRRLLQKDIQIVEVQLARLDGRVTPTPVAEPPPPRGLPTMLDVFASWAKSQDRERTRDTYRGFVAEFESRAGALPCVAIELEDVEAFCDRLEARELSRETIVNYIGGMATLFRHAQSERLVPPTTPNAFDIFSLDHLPKRPRSEDRRAFEIAELKMFFRSPVYTSDYRPEGQVSEAARLAPLGAAFMGARIEEICQARTEDVLCINGVWALRISELDEEQREKNDASWRYVPIHEELIRCGFLAHAASVRLAGKRRLFPSLRNDNKYGLWSNAMGKWFSRYLDSIGLEDDRLCFHSFRFSFRQWCTHSGIGDEARDALTGHWLTTPGRGYMRVAERQYPFPLLADAMRSFRYGELDLSHLYVLDAMRGVTEAFGPAGESVHLPRPVKRKRAPMSRP